LATGASVRQTQRSVSGNSLCTIATTSTLVPATEDTPDLRPDLFEPLRGRRARRHHETGEI
jgi:hypothetical protein